MFNCVFYFSGIGLKFLIQEKELIKLNNKSSNIESADFEKEIEKLDLELAKNYEKVSAKSNFFQYKKRQKLDSLMKELGKSRK